MSNPHKFKADLFATYLPSLFDNKVKAIVTHGQDTPRKELNNLFNWSINSKETSVITVKCKAFTVYVPIKYNDASFLDLDFDDIPITLYTNYGNTTTRIADVKVQLKLISDIVHGCIGASGLRKHIQVNKNPFSIELYTFSSSFYGVKIDMKQKMFFVEYYAHGPDELIFNFKSPHYQLAFDDFNADIEGKTSEIKKLFKKMETFHKVHMPKLNAEMIAECKKRAEELYWSL